MVNVGKYTIHGSYRCGNILLLHYFRQIERFDSFDFDRTCWFWNKQLEEKSVLISKVRFQQVVVFYYFFNGTTTSQLPLLYPRGVSPILTDQVNRWTHDTCAAGTCFTRSRQPSTISCAVAGALVSGWLDDAGMIYQLKVIQIWNHHENWLIHGQYTLKNHVPSVAFDILFHPDMMNYHLNSVTSGCFPVKQISTRAVWMTCFVDLKMFTWPIEVLHFIAIQW